MRIRLTVALVLFGAGWPAVPAGAAVADHDQCLIDTELAIARQLESHPGGRRVGPDTVAYDRGALLITFRPDSCRRLRSFSTCQIAGGNRRFACLWTRPNTEGDLRRYDIKNKWINLRADPLAIRAFGSLENDHPGDLLIKKTRSGVAKAYRTGSLDPDTLDGTNPVGYWPLICLKTAARGSCA